MVDLGIPELTTEQIETLCSIAEDAARKNVLSKISFKMIDRLDVAVEASGSKPFNVDVEIDLVLSRQAKGCDAQKIVNEAVSEAHKASEIYLRKLK